MTDVMKRHLKLGRQRCQRVVVGHYGGYLHIESTIVGFHQEIPEAMGLLGRQHHYALASGIHQFHMVLFRQDLGQLLQQLSFIELAFKFGTHEKAPLLIIDKLVVLDDVQSVLKAYPSDSGDKPIFIGTINHQYFAWHIGSCRCIKV